MGTQARPGSSLRNEKEKTNMRKNTRSHITYIQDPLKSIKTNSFILDEEKRMEKEWLASTFENKQHT